MTKIKDLAKVSKGERALAQRLDPTIETVAKPASDWLLQGRADANSDLTLQALFREAKAEDRGADWLAEVVENRLLTLWKGEGRHHVGEVARYLADEYFQLGEGIHLVSKETGRVIVTVTEDDIYQPAMVPREGGGMAKPLPRLNPALEAFITTWTFEQGREERILMDLVEKGHKVMTLDDPRLHAAIRAGRSQIVRDVAESSPESLLRAAGGTSAAFLDYFDLRTTPPDDASEPDLEGCIEAKSVLHIGDPTTTNPMHDRRAALRGVIPQGWVREMARALAAEAHRRLKDRVVTFDKDHMPATNELPGTFWVIPPEAVREFIQPTWTIMPVEGAKILGIWKPKVGTIQIPEQMAAASHELFDRWEAVADLDYKMWIDWGALTCLEVTGLEYQAVVV